MNEFPPITLCIINFNGQQHLSDAFRALSSQRWPFAEVLLVDNASTDASVDLARSLYPNLTVIRLQHNLGPGVARNAGFRAARNNLVLFQDNDICLTTATAEKLVQQLMQESALLVAPRVVYMQDPGTVQFDSADCHFLGLMAVLNGNVPVADLDDAPRKTTSVVTACFLIDRERWQDEHLFTESIEFNLEDHDLGVRASVLGHHLWVLPTAVVRHGSGTPGLSYRPGERPSAARLYNLTLNRWKIVAKCFSTRTLVVLLPALLFYELMQFTWLTSTGRFGVWLRAVRNFGAARGDVLRERKTIQASRLAPDIDVLKDTPLPLTAYVRGGTATAAIISVADDMLRKYYRVVRRWL